MGKGLGNCRALEGVERSLKKAGRKSRWSHAPAHEVGERSSELVTLFITCDDSLSSRLMKQGGGGGAQRLVLKRS